MQWRIPVLSTQTVWINRRICVYPNNMPCDFAAVDDASETSLSATAVETTNDSLPTPSGQVMKSLGHPRNLCLLLCQESGNEVPMTGPNFKYDPNYFVCGFRFFTDQ